MLIQDNVLALTISIYDLAKRWNISVEEILKRARNSILTLCIYADELLALEIPSYAEKQKQINKMVIEGMELHAARVVFIEAEKELRKSRPDLRNLKIFNSVRLKKILVAILPSDIASLLSKKEVIIEQVISINKEKTYQIIPQIDEKILIYIDKAKSISISCSDLRITKEEIDRIEKNYLSLNQSLLIPQQNKSEAININLSTNKITLKDNKNTQGVSVTECILSHFLMGLLLITFPYTLRHPYGQNKNPNKSRIISEAIGLYEGNSTNPSLIGLDASTIQGRFRQSLKTYNAFSQKIPPGLFLKATNSDLNISKADQNFDVTLALITRAFAVKANLGSWLFPDHEKIATKMLATHLKLDLSSPNCNAVIEANKDLLDSLTTPLIENNKVL